MSDDIENSKCVIIVRDSLPSGLATNAASVVALTLGQRVPALIGSDVKDADGTIHAGITLISVPILKAPDGKIADLHAAAMADPGLIVVGFSDTAQACRTYDEYINRMAGTPAAELSFASLGLFGPRKQISRLTGSLSLVR